MIGDQTTDTIPGVRIRAQSHTGLLVTVDGRPARLAIVDEDGRIIAAGKDVAREAEAVAVQSYREMLKGKGWLKVLSPPLQLVV